MKLDLFLAGFAVMALCVFIVGLYTNGPQGLLLMLVGGGLLALMNFRSN